MLFSSFPFSPHVRKKRGREGRGRSLVQILLIFQHIQSPGFPLREGERHQKGGKEGGKKEGMHHSKIRPHQSHRPVPGAKKKKRNVPKHFGVPCPGTRLLFGES